MSFLDQIEKIQKKPDNVRKRIATITTVLSTCFIVIIWLTVTKPFSLRGGEKPKDIGNDPFSIIKDIKDTVGMAGVAISDIKENVNQLKKYAETVKGQAEELATSTKNENIDLNNIDNLYGQNQ